jgi:NAD(P)-dependent dehydrogenase (short-subunit alcohol dehydrogenase family)
MDIMKIMLITGASRGIGAATALLAAEAGYAVAVNYFQSEQAARDIVAQIEERGGKAITIQADASNADDVVRMFRETDERLGRLDVLVNNAGVLETQMRLEDMASDRWQRVLNANVVGPFLCSQQAIARMSPRYGGRGGAIVNVSSLAARTGSPNEYVDYAASKGALDSMTIGLAKEVAGDGIRVNAVRPAFIHTDIHASGGDPGRVERLKPSIPLQRGGTAREVAEAILFLADKATFSTGTFIDVSGGP